ncbi:MAG TPA: ABC transporter permease, partial [Aggregatilineales bacterium]|nr:ABC transporter permease [Aggregatilineales bacterium]
MNKLADNVGSALTSLLANKLRAVLTTIGIGIGIAAVIVLVSLGNSVQDYLNRQLLSVGTDLIAISPQVDFAGPAVDRGSRLAANSLTQKDLTLLSDPFSLPNVKSIVPLMLATRLTTYAQNTESAQVYGTTASYFDTLNRAVASGELFTDDDVTATARVAVLGQTTVKNLFPADVSPIGSTIRIGDVSFRVIGTLQKTGGGGGGGNDQDDLIIVPLSAAQTFLVTTRDVSGQHPLQAIYLKAQVPAAVDDIALTATAILHLSHRIKPGKD